MKTKLVRYTIFLIIILSLILPQSIAMAITDTGSRACFPAPAGLSSWWPGDGNTDDIVGGRDAALQGATYAAGLVDQAFSLDGVDDFVSVPHDIAPNLGTGDFTIALWVYFNDTTGEQVLIEKWIQHFEGEVGSLGWTMTKLEGNALRLAMSEGGEEIAVDSDGLSIPLNTWIFFAATRKGSTITLYMNGVPVVVGEASLNLDSDSSLKFGHRGNPSDTPGSQDERGFYLNGQIDEVELYIGQALPRGLMQAIYNTGSAGLCKD